MTDAAFPGPWLRPALTVLGGAGLIVAVAWWSIIFGPVISNSYLSVPEALACGVTGSTVCDLAASLCKSYHLLGIRFYSPVLIWSAVGVLSLAALMEARRGSA